MLNIVVPMAGRGSRFADVGYKDPKPLIDISGHPMIEYVIKNITPECEHRFIFICQKEHLNVYDLEGKLNVFAPGCVILPIEYITEGAACTVLLVQEYINSDDALMIANSDQFVATNIDEYIAAMGDMDGLIMTMPANHPKWSYIKYDSEGYVKLVREKEVISDQATVGIYNFRRGADFVRYANQMIEKEIRVNNEFYVAPVYNEMIEDGRKVIYKDVGEKMHGLGTPEDLNLFMNSDTFKNLNIF